MKDSQPESQQADGECQAIEACFCWLRMPSDEADVLRAPFARCTDAFTTVMPQALSKRIHYGKFVAEAKFLAAEDEYRALIAAQDAEGIMDALTDRAVEQKARHTQTAPLAAPQSMLYAAYDVLAGADDAVSRGECPPATLKPAFHKVHTGIGGSVDLRLCRW